MSLYAWRALSVLTVALSLFLTGSVSAAVSCPTLTRTLTFGSRGADVTQLQTFLASDPTLYPEGTISGYFGRATEKAVQRFQTRRGIVSSGTPSTTGYGAVGARTRAALASCSLGAAQPPAAPATTTVQTPTAPTPPAAPASPTNPLVTFADGATTTITLGAGAAPSIITFSFSPRAVDLTGDPVNMYWTSMNAFNCSIDKLVNGVYSVVHENVGVNGSTNLTVTDNPTTYSLRCIGIGDNSTSTPSSVRRDVSATISHLKPTCSVTTDKDSYTYTKDTIILKWTSEGADDIRFAHPAGAVDPVPLPYGNQMPSGTLILSSVAGSSQTATLNVSGYGGTATCSKSFSIISSN